MLNKEPFETLLSFIISQRKCIPAIKTCIEKICAKYGGGKESNGTVYYSFTTSEVLAHTDYYTSGSCGVGNGNGYIVKADKAVLDGKLHLEKLRV